MTLTYLGGRLLQSSYSDEENINDEEDINDEKNINDEENTSNGGKNSANSDETASIGNSETDQFDGPQIKGEH